MTSGSGAAEVTGRPSHATAAADGGMPPIGSSRPAAPRGPLRAFGEQPRSAALAAAIGLSLTAILFALSDTSPGTATFYRGALAVPFLWWLARREDAVAGARPWRARRWALLAGVFFGIDLLLFHESILLMGAGLASVMSNLQVVFVAFAAWLVWAERPTPAQLAGIPIALAGIVLISGVVGDSAFGADPVLGALLGVATAVTYAAYLLLIRKGRDHEHAAGPILDASLACAVTGLVGGLVVGDLELLPGLDSLAWLLLLALSAQLVAAVLLAVALPRLPAATTSLILLVQPVLAVVLAILILAETPSAAQSTGVVLVIVGVVLGSARRRSAPQDGVADEPERPAAPTARPRLPWQGS